MSKYRDPVLPPQFWDRVTLANDGCWIWTGRTNHGYGLVPWVMVGEKNVRSHRVTYETFVGSIPDGLEIDHLCRKRACCNPAHLEAVTSAENTRRGLAGWHKKVKALDITHCPRGHEYTPENTYVRPGRPSRDCVTCRREACARHQAKRREQNLVKA